jgi:hypothetical protein
MTNIDHFDILLQFQQTVMQDVQHRILNASPLTTLWVKSPLTRRLEQPLPPLEVKACWNSPGVTVSDGGIELAADLNGGARQVLSGRILTLDGTVSARQTVTCAVDASQRPYVCVKEPTPAQLNMRQLKVSYEGSRWPALLAKLNPAKEATVLRPVLASELFGPLARIPLTCMPYSLPVSMPDKQGGAAEGTLPIKRVVPGLLATPASAVLGLMLDDKRAAPAISAGVLPPQTRYNAAIALSEHGLNALLTHLCEQGEARGQAQHTRLGQIEWRWEKLHVTLRQEVLAISGLLVQQGVKISVVAEVKSTLVNNGCVQSHIVSSNVDASTTETLLASWNGMLNILFRSRAANKRDQDVRDAERLFQCFDMPESKHTVETVAQELVTTDEQLIISYIIPRSVKEFPLEIPPPKPAVTITQPHIPQQTAQGAPVTIELDAQIIKDSTPPYDYAWTTDLSPNPVPQFGSTFTVSSVPVMPAVGEGLQTLTMAHLKVIDMFGQVAETQAPAQYLPYTKQKQEQQKKSTGSGIWGVLVAIAIIVGVYAATHAGPGGSPVGQQTGVYMTFTGALNGSLSVPNPVACGVSKLNSANYEIQASGSVNGTSYLLLIQVSPYSGRGTYHTSDSSGLVALQGDSNDWGSNSQPGSITITSDRTGSVSATMASGNSQVQVSGSWICP